MAHKGHQVRAARIACELTQLDLERITGVPRSAISAIENGRWGLGKHWAVKLGAALNIPPAELIDWPEVTRGKDADS